MSQAKYSWQQAFYICNLLVKDKQVRRLSGQLGCGLVAAWLCWMNWKLFLSTGVGIGLMSLCYLGQNSHWQNYLRQWRKFFVGANRQLTFAVGAGSAGAFGTYLATSVWAEADNRWLATGSILQGLVSLLTLVLLLWSWRGNKVNSLEEKLDRLLNDLSHRDRLKRLVAIRQLTRLLIGNRLSAADYQQSIEYFQLMLAEPQPPAIRNALLESLTLLDVGQSVSNASAELKAVKIPLKLQHSRALVD